MACSWRTAPSVSRRCSPASRSVPCPSPSTTGTSPRSFGYLYQRCRTRGPGLSQPLRTRGRGRCVIHARAADASGGRVTTPAHPVSGRTTRAPWPPPRTPATSRSRSADDLYCVYTGGTTGMPKGVLWRHEDIFFAGMGGGDPLALGNFIGSPEQLATRVMRPGMTALPARPSCMRVRTGWRSPCCSAAGSS